MQMTNLARFARPRLLALAVVLAASAAGAAWAQDPVAEARAQAEASPEDPRGWVALGNALLDGGDTEEAKDAYLEAIAVDYRACDAHYGLGLAEFARGDYQAALFAFDEVTRLCDERFDGHYNRAVTLARLRRPAEAAEAFREAIAQAEPEASPADRVAAWTGLAGQRTLTGEHDAAAEAYTSALQIRPTDDELIFLRAEALQNAGRGLEALPDLTDLEGRSRDYRVSALIAEVYVDQGQVDRALRSLNRALEQAEADGDRRAQASLLVTLGLLQRDLGRDGASAESFARAAELAPDSWEAQYNLGVSLLEAGRTADALAALETARDAAPQSGEVALALASAYDQSARPADAVEAATRAVELLEDPEALVEARFVAGRNAYRLGDYGTARTLLETVVDARPESAAAQLWTGLATYQQGDFAAAVPYYERAVQLDPNDVAARVNLGAAYLATERYGDAETVYQLLVQQNASDAESRYNLGWALLGQDRRGPAREAWTAACDLGLDASCEALVRYF